MREESFRVKRYVLSKYVPLRSVLDYMGIEYALQGNFYCPFHEDSLHPSAHFYESNTGQAIFCFAEHKTYRTYDAIKLLTPQNPDKVFYSIWNKFSFSEQETILLENEQEIETLPYYWKQSKDLLSPFESGTIDFVEYQKRLLRILTNNI